MYVVFCCRKGTMEEVSVPAAPPVPLYCVLMARPVVTATSSKFAHPRRTCSRTAVRHQPQWHTSLASLPSSLRGGLPPENSRWPWHHLHDSSCVSCCPSVVRRPRSRRPARTSTVTPRSELVRAVAIGSASGLAAFGKSSSDSLSNLGGCEQLCTWRAPCLVVQDCTVVRYHARWACTIGEFKIWPCMVFIRPEYSSIATIHNVHAHRSPGNKNNKSCPKSKKYT